MALIINCDSCNKKMGSLERFIVKDDKYLCLKCGEEDTPKTEAAPETPDNIDPHNFGIIVFCTDNTYYKHAGYQAFIDYGFNYEGAVKYAFKYYDRFNMASAIIIADKNAWCIYEGQNSAFPIARINYFDKELVEKVLKHYITP